MSGKNKWRVAAATAAGTSHVRDCRPNQDAVAHRLVNLGDGQIAIIAVADGAGSAPRSGEGADIAVHAAVAAVAEGISRTPAAAFGQLRAGALARAAVKHAKDEVTRYAQRQAASPRELASTLILAFASDWLFTAAQVGDGAVIAFDLKGETAKTLCTAHTGEYANETTFLTSRSKPHEIASVGHASGLTYGAMALITDGLQNLALKMPEREAFLGFWNAIVNDLANTDEPEAVSGRLLSFISGERVRSRTTDDVTIAVATRHIRNAEGDKP